MIKINSILLPNVSFEQCRDTNADVQITYHPMTKKTKKKRPYLKCGNVFLNLENLPTFLPNIKKKTTFRQNKVI